MDDTIQKKIIGPGLRRAVALHLATALALACVFWGAGFALAQAPPLPAEAGPDAPADVPAAGPGAGIVGGPGDIKLGFLVFDQLSYKVHPFKTLTGDTQFDQNISAKGSSGLFGSPVTDDDEDFVSMALHSLPPFRLDYNRPMNLVFPQGIGVGVDYTKVSQTDVGATTGALDISGFGARLTMDTYILSIPVRFYGFDPTQPGINYFIGFSLGFINGNLLVQDATGTGTDQIIPFSQSPIGMTRMGIEVTGEGLGGRFELTTINASEVEFDSNPITGGGGVTTVDMSGTMLQLTLYWVIE